MSIELDLHGFKHEEAIKVLDRTINSQWGSDQELRIITGYSPHLMKLVVDILKQYKLVYYIGDFSGVNMGYIRTVLD